MELDLVRNRHDTGELQPFRMILYSNPGFSYTQTIGGRAC
jgi:hypothetical protein